METVIAERKSRTSQQGLLSKSRSREDTFRKSQASRPASAKSRMSRMNASQMNISQKDSIQQLSI
jgi:hypothetical protein